jgi:hypothetical protein
MVELRGQHGPSSLLDRFSGEEKQRKKAFAGTGYRNGEQAGCAGEFGAIRRSFSLEKGPTGTLIPWGRDRMCLMSHVAVIKDFIYNCDNT